MRIITDEQIAGEQKDDAGKQLANAASESGFRPGSSTNTKAPIAGVKRIALKIPII